VQSAAFYDICAREVVNPLIINPRYSAQTATAPLIPYFKDIQVTNLPAVLGSMPDGPVVPIVTLQGYDSAHPANVRLNNVLIEAIMPANVVADTDTPNMTLNVTFAGQGANFAAPPEVTEVDSPAGIACGRGWPVPRPQ
jgi:hypothetical protein